MTSSHWKFLLSILPGCRELHDIGASADCDEGWLDTISWLILNYCSPVIFSMMQLFLTYSIKGLIDGDIIDSLIIFALIAIQSIIVFPTIIFIKHSVTFVAKQKSDFSASEWTRILSLISLIFAPTLFVAIAKIFSLVP